MEWRIERFGFIVENDEGDLRKMTRKVLRILNVDKFIDEFRFIKHGGLIAATWIINGQESRYGSLTEQEFKELLRKIKCPKPFWTFIL